MTTDSASWYVPGEGKQPTGPFTAEQVLQSWRAGRLDSNTVCWREGMTQWLPLSQVEPFATAIRAATASRHGSSDFIAQPLPPTQPQTAASTSYQPGVKKASRVPAALRFLPFVACLVAIVGLGTAYVLMGGFQRKNSADIAPRGRNSGSPFTSASKNETEERGGPPNQGEIGNPFPSVNQEAEGAAPSDSTERATAGKRQSPDITDIGGDGGDTASQNSTPKSEMARSSSRRSRSRKVAPEEMKSQPESVDRKEPEEIPGLRSVPRFIEPPLECTRPCWSLDGKYIMFIGRPTEQAGGVVREGRRGSGVLPGNVWVISADGSKRWLVSNFFFGGLQPPAGRQPDALKLDVAALSWSPDGGKIAILAYEGEERPIGLPTNLYVMKADATDIFQVSKGTGWGELGDAMQWTPDGKGLLLSGSASAAMIDLEGTKRTPVTGPGGGKLTNACSSRDGKKLAAIGEYSPVVHGICVLGYNARQVKWLSRQEDFGGSSTRYWPQAWSPDGNEILVTSTDLLHDTSISAFSIVGGKQRRLVEGDRPQWSPDGTRIVLEGGLGGGQGDLCLIDPDGRNLRRITNLTPPGVQMIWGSQPSWSPDSKRIVFRRSQYVWVANRDGTDQTCVVRGTDYTRGYEHGWTWPCTWAPGWKPGGYVVFARYHTKDYPIEIELCEASADSAQSSQIIVLKSTPGDSDGLHWKGEFCWSRDGSKMAFDRNDNIWVAKGNGTEQTRLTGGRHPRWSPDGEKILFVRGSERNEVLCVVDANGSNQTQITDLNDGYRSHHSWCPDGKKIAFESKNGLSVVSARGGDARRLVWGQQPCWSPDGEKIAFCAMGRLTSDTGAKGPPCVYVMNADGTDMRPVMQVDGTAYGSNLVSSLAWSPEGKHLVFEETARMGYDYANRHHIWIVDVSEPVFYQASYIASDLLPWKVPQFVPVQEPESSSMAEEDAQTTEGKQLSPAEEKPAGQRASGKRSGLRSGPRPGEPAASKGTKQPASPKSTSTIIE